MKTNIRYHTACMALVALTEEPQGYYITERYEYPILSRTEKREALPNNLAAKVNACAILLDLLEYMKTGTLLETILTYPRFSQRL